MNPFQPAPPERVEFPGTDERITPDQWEQQILELRSILAAAGLSEEQIADDLRGAFGEFTFADDDQTIWRHDGAWWRWAGSTWERATPVGGLRVHKAVFEMLPDDEPDPDLDLVLAEAEGLAADYERFVAEHPDEPWPDDADEDDAAEVATTPDLDAAASGLATPYKGTHSVPQSGMQTWARPGDAQTGPQLDPGLIVQKVKTWGDWANIECDNGWTAWVDARLLVPVGVATDRDWDAPSPRPLPVATVASERPVAANPQGQRFVKPTKRTLSVSAGAAAVALGAFLPWFDIGAGVPSQSAFDGALKYLVDYKDPGTGLRIGLVLLVIAIGAFGAGHMRGWERAVRPLAMLGVAIGVMFIVQTQRALSAASDAGGVAPGVFDVIGFGVWISIAGAALMLLPARRK